MHSWLEFFPGRMRTFPDWTFMLMLGAHFVSDSLGPWSCPGLVWGWISMGTLGNKRLSPVVMILDLLSSPLQIRVTRIVSWWTKKFWHCKKCLTAWTSRERLVKNFNLPFARLLFLNLILPNTTKASDFISSIYTEGKDASVSRNCPPWLSKLAQSHCPPPKPVKCCWRCRSLT